MPTATTINQVPYFARTIISQIGADTRMACGARDFAFSVSQQSVTFRVGSGSATRGKVAKITVKLDASDTYTVTYGYMINRRGPRWGEWVDAEQVSGVYADQLAATVRRMGDRERY